MSIKWKVDSAHSEIQFKAKHLMITTVTGYFKKFNIEVETETENFQSTKEIKFTADVDSITTNNEQRDAHLRSDDFFNVEEHKQVIFSGNKFEMKDDNIQLYGDLTIRGITKPVIVNVEFGGIAVDPYGQTKAGFTISSKINRKDFGLKWDAVTEAGSVVVSNEIKVLGEIQLIKQG